MIIVSLSKSILKFITSAADLDADMYEVYQYGIEITISSFLNLALIFLFGWIINDLMAAVCFLICIIPLRLLCGGYHASTYFRCNSIFVLTFLTDYLLATITKNYSIGINVLQAILLLSFIPIVLFAPVRNKHKELTPNARKRCRLFALILSVVFSIISLMVFHYDSLYGSLLVLTQATVSVMIILEILIQRRNCNEGKSDFS